jgi:hypothetical protein
MFWNLPEREFAAALAERPAGADWQPNGLENHPIYRPSTEQSLLLAGGNSAIVSSVGSHNSGSDEQSFSRGEILRRRGLPNTTEKFRNILNMRPVTTRGPPGTTKMDATRRLHSMLKRRAAIQFVLERSLKVEAIRFAGMPRRRARAIGHHRQPDRLVAHVPLRGTGHRPG